MSYMLMGDSGTVVFERTSTVTGESVKLSSKATSNPIEGGGNINDHAALDPIKFDINVIVTSESGYQTLESMWRNRDLLTYRGAESYDNLLILNLSRKRSVDNSDGYTLTISFQRMDIASAAFIPITGPTMSQQDAGAKTGQKSAKKKTENGLSVPSGDYASYVNQFNGSNSNTSITQPRTNPSYAGYGG